ncbi:hypothetical protein [Myxococcus stipitatus]|uniref:hypothetical protein n=1 Tax=Myxococcus stipitatus TaxID=83455 RepID=UPI0030D1EFCD
MRIRSLATSFLLSAVLGGCADSEAPFIPPTDQAPHVDPPARTANIAGVVFDPEAFFFTMMMFPVEGDDGPPPAVFDGPYLGNAAITGGQVTLTSPEGREVVLPPAPPGGVWQAIAVPAGDTTAYIASATPPAEGVEFDPESPVPLPTATYFRTTYVRPIVTSVSQCLGQSALLVGSAGALDAVAQHLTAAGTPTTVADLLNPAKTGGVALLWVHGPSFPGDLFLSPLDSVAGEASAGQLIALDWAPPEGAPGQSPMGFAALPDAVSMVGYFALVLPPGTSAPVTVRFTDTFTLPPGEEPDPEAPPRPMAIPQVTVEPRAGVSVYRSFAQPPEPPPGGGGLEDPGPPEPSFDWVCMAPPEGPPPAEKPR